MKAKSQFMKHLIQDPRSPSGRTCIAAMLCLAAATAYSARSNVIGDGEQPGSIALTIGSFKVSEARVDMNFMKFAEKSRTALSADQIHVWLEGFIQRQILTAEAIDLGYGQRLEVAAKLRQMEEHMLTDSDGPLYGLLLRKSPKPLSSDEVYAREETTYQMEIIEVPKSSPEHASVSKLIGDSTPGEEARVANWLRQSDQVEYRQGSFAWPFEPVEGASEAICNAPVGRWQSVDDCDATVLFRIASKRRMPQPPRQEVQAMLEKMAAHWALEDVRHNRAMDLMASGSLGFDWDAAESIIVNLKAARPEAGSELTSKLLGMSADRLLAQLESQEGRQVVSVGDFIQYYNSLFVRRLPERPIDVYDLVKNFLLFRRDLRDARKLGLDRAGDFSEHKENYRDALILDLYENERVRPKLHLGRAAADDYYNNHRTEYERPIRIGGRIYTFESASAAAEFAKATASLDGKPRIGDLPFESITMSSETTYDGMPPLCKMIFSARKPKLVGPFPMGNLWIVWTYERTLESVQVPFASVEQQIIHRLQQPLIAPFEDGLARSLASKLPINNRISEERLLLKSRGHKEST
jgi:hypothetical protein